jgi:site-specific recombinase XerD
MELITKVFLCLLLLCIKRCLLWGRLFDIQKKITISGGSKIKEFIMETRNGKYREMIWMGKKPVKSPWFNRMTEAKTWKRHKQLERDKSIANGIDPGSDVNILFEDYARAWLKIKASEGIGESTKHDYERVFRLHIFPLTTNLFIRELNETHAEKLIAKLQDKKYSPEGINHILMVFKSVLIYAVQRFIIPRNPLVNVKSVTDRQRAFSYWSEEDIQFFLRNSQNTPYFPFLLTALYTGMRRGEIAGLYWDCVDFLNNRITVKRVSDRYGVRNRTKTGVIRYVPMNDFLKTYLLKLFQTRSSNSPFVFANEINGESLDVHHIYRVFKQLQKKIGMRNQIRFHDLRHTFASQFMMKGGNIFDLQKILGHSDTKTTQIYAHLSPEHLSKTTEHLKFGIEDELQSMFNPMLTQTDNFELLIS